MSGCILLKFKEGSFGRGELSHDDAIEVLRQAFFTGVNHAAGVYCCDCKRLYFGLLSRDTGFDPRWIAVRRVEFRLAVARHIIEPPKKESSR